jgi:hypothetical protein
VRSALSKVEWIDTDTLGANRVTQQIWFKVKPNAAFDLNGLKSAIEGPSGGRYKLGKMISEPAKGTV